MSGGGGGARGEMGEREGQKKDIEAWFGCECDAGFRFNVGGVGVVGGGRRRVMTLAPQQPPTATPTSLRVSLVSLCLFSLSQY